MSSLPKRIAVISDSNADVLVNYLQNLPSAPKLEVKSSPFGQAMQILMDSEHVFWKEKYDYAIVLTQPACITETLNKVELKHEFNQQILKREVGAFAQSLIKLRERVTAVFVPNWVIPSWKYNPTVGDFKKGGPQYIISMMNFFLVEEIDPVEGCYILSTNRLVENSTGSAFNPKLWFVAKQIFSNSTFKNMAIELKSAILGIEGQSRKIIILDLDDTLWGGTVGDDGASNLRLGGHDPVGEAFVEFQRGLKRLKETGVLLAISSKNEESIALEVIQTHPEMILKLNDFASWQINWDDKARNVEKILKDLNLGAQSAVFIDNSPIERERVQKEFPEILVPQWPKDETHYPQALSELKCFDKPVLTAEDLSRTAMMIQEKERNLLKSNVGSGEDWLGTLGIKCAVEELNTSNLNRVVQLFNKTNQMNLTTRRLSAEELMAWASQKDNKVFAIRVADKFGDYGLTGIVGVSKIGTDTLIQDYILSCRVMGRKVEEAMLNIVYEVSKEYGSRKIIAKYQRTDKNAPCYRFFQGSGFFENPNDATFSWDIAAQYPSPKQIELNWEN